MNLECPACHHELQTLELDNGKLTVDVCAGHCGGIWFDNRELQRVDEQSEAIGEQLLNIPRDPALKVDMTSKRRCPVCQNIKMMRHFFSVKRSIEVDECAGCGGIWLDIEAPEDADADVLEQEIVDFFKLFRRATGPARAARP